MAQEFFSKNTPPIVRQADQEILGAIAEGSQNRLIFDAEATSGLAGALEIRLAVGAHGASPHLHKKSGELFYVVAGKVEVLCDEAVLTVAEGDTFFVPPRTIHAFGAAPDSSARLFSVLTPGTQRFEYFRLLDAVERGEADRSALAESQEQYDNYFVKSLVWEQHRAVARKSVPNATSAV
ncbi:Cupin 2 conserved barrel domain protein [Segniliparus rotundus DSM 44985]|uniref:Cupin 2 conserved barrel domain protein n=1 Tax=Segniliparus rotundus (strain ATCC BAA-972 / CDC 1076 / CIP 108378 / DSM 44985 / JCM 13578) TaxID=640132 RepID=D6Z7K3_SEGRD|nr:cupin domain-containing protein [Segniliparus rotundus]ADG97933.1 Cupin 2 conserved barrel domain protein [Segniliparus rotundus DSM 44985]